MLGRLLVLRPPRVSGPAAYAFAVSITLVIFGIQHELFSWLTVVPFILLFLAVFLASWVGGRGPGLVATLLSAAAADYHFLAPMHTWSTTPRALVLLGLFLVVSTVVNLLSGALRDAVDEAERAASLLRFERDINQSITENAAEAIFVTDREGRVAFCNREATLVFGFAREELKGRVLHDLLHRHRSGGTPSSAAGCPLARINAERGTARDRQDVFFKKDGAAVDVTCSSAPLEVGGERAGAVLVARDMTERKRAEQALRDADRRKDEFLAVLSHELRNPLAPIRNSLFILARAAPGGEQARRAQAIIERQTGHLTRLVDDLLDVTRISRGKVRLQMAPLDLRDLIQASAEDYRTLFAAAGVALEVALPEHPFWVHGDAARLAQVVGNLLHNAAKFSQRGARVRLALARDERAAGALVRVRDWGAGISPEMLPRLFEPFAQAENTLDRSRGGLGLGLALVKGMVELHGGRVEAHSEGLGSGAEFTIRLPLAADPARVEQRPSKRQPARRVLVIEDNADSADSLREVLELAQHEVEVARDGPEGIARARSLRPDVVLCDIGLPGMSGYEVAKAIRSDRDLQGVYLVALTGYASPEDIAAAERAGFERHLAKPPSLERLEEVLGSAVAAGRGRLRIPARVEEGRHAQN